MFSSRTSLAIGFLTLLPMCGCSSSDNTPANETDASASPTLDATAPHPPKDGAAAADDAALSTGVDAGGSNDAGRTVDSGKGEDAGGEALDVSFAFVGCNRLQKVDWSSQTNPSSANTAQLHQTFSDVAALATSPKFFFFTGDLVLGLNTDTTLMKGQLDGWAQAHATDPSGIATKSKLIPLVGNHEMLAKVAPAGGGAKVELQNTGADAIWTPWLTAKGFDTFAGNGPTTGAPNSDALMDDQSKLTYSFDDGDVHYVVLNTDTWTSTADNATGSTQIGWVALHWLQADLAAAQAKPAIRHIFVLGHKPIVSPVPSPAADDAINSAFTTSLETLLLSTGKVRGYLCAHAHQWDARKLPGSGSHDVYQIIAGNGGSQLETAWSPAYYGFTLARVYTTGRVGITSYQRPVPNPYTASAQPAVAQPELTIAP